MPIFNSLGSNYTLSDALLNVRQLWFHRDLRPELINKIEKLLAGKVELFYKGRDAIEYALRYYGIGNDDQVITQAFACYAIEEAITRVGARPVYMDITADSLNPDVKTLAAAYHRAPSAKAVLIQHTLGTPAPVKEIKKWCQEHRLILIEDLAQSIGGHDQYHQPLGTYGDAIILSFGRDKMIDGVSGGAVVIKTSQSNKSKAPLLTDGVDRQVIIKDMCYPLITWLIRQTHRFGLGKIIFQLAKKTGWLTSPIASSTSIMTRLPAQYAPLILLQFDRLRDAVRQRTRNAQLYAEQLSVVSPEQIKVAANLRVAIMADDPDKLAKHLSKQHIYLTDRWYRKPVDYGSLNCHSEYVTDSCPRAEQAAQQVLNLPTHQGIKANDIQRIVTAIKNYQML